MFTNIKLYTKIALAIMAPYSVILLLSGYIPESIEFEAGAAGLLLGLLAGLYVGEKHLTKQRKSDSTAFRRMTPPSKNEFSLEKSFQKAA